MVALNSILTGWGKHSKVAGDSTVKRAVESRLLEIRAPFHVGRYNEGRLVCAGHVVRAWLQDPRTLELLVLRDIVAKPGRIELPNIGILSLKESCLGDAAK